MLHLKVLTDCLNSDIQLIDLKIFSKNVHNLLIKLIDLESNIL